MDRSLKEIVQIVIDSLKKGNKDNYYNYGICGEAKDLWYNLIINTNEKEEFLYYLETLKPQGIETGYWWGWMYKNDKNRQIRIDFLTEHLAKL